MTLIGKVVDAEGDKNLENSTVVEIAVFKNPYTSDCSMRGVSQIFSTFESLTFTTNGGKHLICVGSGVQSFNPPMTY
jgi:hypothetical protein